MPERGGGRARAVRTSRSRGGLGSWPWSRSGLSGTSGGRPRRSLGCPPSPSSSDGPYSHPPVFFPVSRDLAEVGESLSCEPTTSGDDPTRRAHATVNEGSWVSCLPWRWGAAMCCRRRKTSRHLGQALLPPKGHAESKAKRSSQQFASISLVRALLLVLSTYCAPLRRPCLTSDAPRPVAGSRTQVTNPPHSASSVSLAH